MHHWRTLESSRISIIIKLFNKQWSGVAAWLDINQEVRGLTLHSAWVEYKLVTANISTLPPLLSPHRNPTAL